MFKKILKPNDKLKKLIFLGIFKELFSLSHILIIIFESENIINEIYCSNQEVI